MDNETKQNDTHGTSATCACEKSNDMMSVLEQSAVPEGICRWLRCLRTPGIVLNYSLEKRHIPDMDAGGQNGASTSASIQSSGRSETNAGKNGAPASASAASKVAEENSSSTIDVMQCAGTFKVRYFDLALGATLLLAACGMIKCMCGCCRCIKRKM